VFIAAGVAVLAIVCPADARAQYPYPPPFGYPVRYDISSSVRIVATPRDAEVYVDGYYAGVVDDFDGFFQRLHVPPGAHEIALYHDGYRSVHQKVYLTARSSQKLQYTMTPLAAGEPNESRPATPPTPPRVPPPGAPSGPPASSSTADTSRVGTLSIRVQPANAEIRVDGERWRGPEADEHLVVQLAEGTHHVEVQRDGYQQFSADIQVHRGETTPLNVSLLTNKPH